MLDPIFRAIIDQHRGDGFLSQTITPIEISDDIRAFALTISDHEPQYVPVWPSADAVPGECFFNVADVVRSGNGERVMGWTIWRWPGVLLEAEHHAVWRNSSGQLVDVTPKADGEARVLFLPDPTAVVEDKARLNIRFADPDSSLAQKFVQGRVEVDAFLEPYRKMNGFEIPKPALKKLKAIGARVDAMARRLLAGER